jgi:pimeloyl-ACP methyl ester carboxylesterase
VADPLPWPVIVVHGMPSSNLWDLYLTEPGAAYILSRGGWPLHLPSFQRNYDHLPMHPDDPEVTLNTTGRAVSPARLAAISAFYLPYEDLVERLKKELGSDDQPAPVFPFAYDWRFDSSVGARALDDFITEVLRITALLPAYKGHPPDKVDLVAHSFGGLVTGRYLRACQAPPARPARVRKVVTIGSPFRGAVYAMFTMIKDLDQRQSARTLPSAYGLLPWFDGATLDTTKNPPAPVDLLTDPTIWNGSSVVRTLDDYCRRMGSAKSGAARLQELRDLAVQQRNEITGLNVTAALGSADNWMPIVGVKSKTATKIRVVAVQPGNDPDAEFAFDPEDAGGDGTVPFQGAIPPFNLATGEPDSLTPLERLVCFSEDDIGLHERGSWLGLAQAIGQVSLHAFLPSMDAVQQTIFGFLRVNAPKVKAIAHPAPGVAPNAVNWPAGWNLAKP